MNNRYRIVIDVEVEDLDEVETIVENLHGELWGNYTILAGPEAPIVPGDWVEHRFKDLDPREVVSVGLDWLTLDILGSETPRLPLDNYQVVIPREGRL